MFEGFLTLNKKTTAGVGTSYVGVVFLIQYARSYSLIQKGRSYDEFRIESNCEAR